MRVCACVRASQVRLCRALGASVTPDVAQHVATTTADTGGPTANTMAAQSSAGGKPGRHAKFLITREK